MYVTEFEKEIKELEEKLTKSLISSNLYGTPICQGGLMECECKFKKEQRCSEEDMLNAIEYLNTHAYWCEQAYLIASAKSEAKYEAEYNFSNYFD